jgi:hypothetical protein
LPVVEYPVGRVCIGFLGRLFNYILDCMRHAGNGRSGKGERYQ